MTHNKRLCAYIGVLGVVLVSDMDRDVNCNSFLNFCNPRPKCLVVTGAAMTRFYPPTEGCCDVEGDQATGYMLCNLEEKSP